jgi:serine/threonine-protein kinase PknK
MVEGLLSGGFYGSIEAKLRSWVDRRKVSERTVREAMADEVARPELAELSKREREILALMAEGKSNAGIAKSLYITEGSVEKHVSSILNKLGLTVEAENHRRVLAVLTYLGLNK